jgi:FkbM family methyltransferase
LKFYTDFKSAFVFARSGKTFKDAAKIFGIFILSFFRNRSPLRLRSIFDLPVRGLTLETDVKFRIRTVFDFFVFSNVWERELADFFEWKKGMTFLDVGAHIGRYTIRAGVKVGDKGKVVAIEANPDNYNLLLENIKLNLIQNCIPLNIAAFAYDTELELFIGADSAKNSVKEDSGKGYCVVQARALDNVLAEAGIKHVNLIKIDVEGAEFAVLQGLANTLRAGSPRVMVEVLTQDAHQIIQYMNNLSYREKLLHYSSDYKEGIAYYSFEKEK